MKKRGMAALLALVMLLSLPARDCVGAGGCRRRRDAAK